jgi:hypothetical protein
VRDLGIVLLIVVLAVVAWLLFKSGAVKLPPPPQPTGPLPNEPQAAAPAGGKMSPTGVAYAAGYTGACLAATGGAGGQLCSGAGQVGYTVGSQVEEGGKWVVNKVRSWF